MDTPNARPGLPGDTSLEATLQTLLTLKREMLALQARLEYLRLMLRLGMPLK